MHATLPRELREMIYSYLLSCPEEKATVKKMTTGLDKYLAYFLSGNPTHYKDTWGYDCCPPKRSYPYFVQAAYVGSETQHEILEQVYRNHFNTCDLKMGLYVLDSLATLDYDPGLVPLHSIRELIIRWRVEPGMTQCLRDPEYFDLGDNHTNLTIPTWKQCFQSLLSVKVKNKFVFILRLRDDHLSLKHLGHLLETFRPVYNCLLAAGSRIYLLYLNREVSGAVIRIDLTEYFSKPADVWRADMKRILDPSASSRSFRWDDMGDSEFDAKAAEIDYTADVVED
ncbi:hypothetical protein BDV95DRAFT_563806 [Massariosphaeria phaeospora]|uniref:Uncharacterized protein n=1 Tax=Massariosphaeria phaeospora TaxID=100035 RepID=A0A7C8IAQ9_9PLEO|nr:hypothetical protein BDV95DRAFT_563806 [Massariosphaeria phaeospora]